MQTSYLNSDDLALCKTVLDEACRDVGATNTAIRSEMAARILARANAGERDFEKLKTSALGWILAA